MQAVRANLLRRLRVPVLRHDHPIHGNQSFYTSLFSTEARSSFLNKGEVTDRVLKVVKQFQKIDPSKVSPSAKFQADLGLDSLDTVEMVMAFEEEFGLEIPDSEADKIDSCSAAIDYIAANPKSK